MTKILLTPEPALSLFSPYKAPHTVEEWNQTADDEAYYEATVGAITILGKFVEQFQNTDSVQLHRVRKTTQSDANTASTQRDAETDAFGQQSPGYGEEELSESASTSNGSVSEHRPEGGQNSDVGHRVSNEVLSHEDGKIKGEMSEEEGEDSGCGVKSEETMDVDTQEERVEEDIEMGDAT